MIWRTVKKKLDLKISPHKAKGNALVLQGPPIRRPALKISDGLVEAYENKNDRQLQRRKISPETFLAIKRRCEENGQLGEEFVLNYERRMLRDLGRADLADQVKWVSQESVCEGYDILSYESDAREKFIEVKTTIGYGRIFEISDYEWRIGCQAGDKYYIGLCT